MAISPNQYEEVLSRYSDSAQATHLLRQYRPYLEMMPSMRRPQESLISIPLPIAEIQIPATAPNQRSQVKSLLLPCDLVFLMCDPEWKVKTDVEILILIHRPGETFSALLSRWRQIQIILSRAYSWDMPLQHRDVFNEGASRQLPLFVLFKETSRVIKRGMKAARLPHVIQPSPPEPQTVTTETLVPDK
ncbi:hypothetical protein L3556_09330 [Candidatus Synechococcus calcipolaris G9]|uniref:Uncharacterized protein n=1 Tax=Candidatus Synechococcus calcipolaris G9 TaxID=1497997 RepID=A0ABT6EZX9_9SYNE|nr:hypothetical protein [Candidatus Synechococcus calcipolaris]MDG2991126.1 hypothetical protein [Candidatus Synechococcus calcipolaris G9]